MISFAFFDLLSHLRLYRSHIQALSLGVQRIAYKQQDAGGTTQVLFPHPSLHSSSNNNALNSMLCRCGAPSGVALSQNAECGVSRARSVSES